MKQITKDEFAEIVAKAVGKETKEASGELGNMQVMVLALLGASLGAKIMELLFENEEKIEIVEE